MSLKLKPQIQTGMTIGNREVIFAGFLEHLGQRVDLYRANLMARAVDEALARMSCLADKLQLDAAFAQLKGRERATLRSAWAHFRLWAKTVWPEEPVAEAPRPRKAEMESGTAALVALFIAKSGLAEKTAKSYATKVRSALRRMTAVDDAAGLAAYVASLSPAARKPFVAAWRAFREVGTTHGFYVPSL